MGRWQLIELIAAVPLATITLPSLSNLPALIWSGCVTGALGALIGASMVMAYRGTGTLNLALGSFYIVGGLVASKFVSRTFLGSITLVVVAGLVGATCAIGQEVMLLRPLARAQASIRLLVTMAFGTLLDGIVIVIWGTQPLNGIPLTSATIRVSSGFDISGSGIMTILFTVFAGISAFVWLRRSLAGHVLSGITEDPVAAEMLGIRVQRFRLMILAVIGSTTAIFGAITVSEFLTEPALGLNLSLEGFIAAYLLGGNLSPMLAVGGGFIVGLIQAFVARSVSSTLSGVVIGVLLILVLAVRRQGILARTSS